MTTDDLKRLAEKYPEHIEDDLGSGTYHISNFDCAFDPSGGLGSFMFRGTAHFLGHPVSEAIFSALLDEIAEKEHGAYLVRRGRAKTFIQSQPEAPYDGTLWHWEARRITDFELLSEGETKLDALLAL